MFTPESQQVGRCELVPHGDLRQLFALRLLCGNIELIFQHGDRGFLRTGERISDVDHISQSIGDILRTPVGSRVMRREYGSLLSQMIDQPQTPALELQIMAACYMAILKWEPRVRLTSITTARQFNGQMVVEVTGQITDTGESLSLTIPVS